MALTQVPSTMMQVGGVPSFDGIKFPASQSASADANTLDDYEEGSFTPTFLVNGSSANVTMTGQQGRYVKIGRLVFVNIQVTGSYSGASTAGITISGFPFSNGGGKDANGVVAWSTGWGAYVPRVMYMGSNGTVGTLATGNSTSWQSSNTATAVQGTSMSSTSSMQMSFCYESD